MTKTATLVLFFLACQASPVLGQSADVIGHCLALQSAAWSRQEQWVWQRLCSRETANLNQREGAPADLAPWNAAPEQWTADRQLSSQFLVDITLKSPYVEALQNNAIRLVGAWFTEPLDFYGAKVVDLVDITDSRFDAHVSFFATDLPNRFVIADSWFRQSVDFFSAIAGKDIILAGSRFDADLNLANVVSDLSIVLQGAEFSGYVNLAGSRLHELVIGSPTAGPTLWHDGASLSLRGSSFNILLDQPGSWDGLKGKLDLQGLVYQRFTGIAETLTTGNSAGSMAERPVGELLEWLEMQQQREVIYIPQPYEQLASVLYDLGQDDKAEAILYAKNEYRRRHATTSFSDQVWLTIKKVVIGYGYQIRLTVGWFVLLLLLGATTLRLSSQGRSLGSPRCLLYSLDQALPFIELNPTHHDIAKGHPIGLDLYFQAHQILSLVLLSFLGAGLAGAIG